MAQSAYSVDFSPIAAVGQEMGAIGQHKEQAAYREEQMAGLKQQHDIQAIQLQELQKEQKRKDTIMPLKNLQGIFDSHPTYANGMLDMANSMKDDKGQPMIRDIGGEKGIAQGDLEYLYTLGDKVYAMGTKQIEWTMRDVNNQEVNLTKQLNEAKDKDKAVIQQQLDAVKKNRADLLNLQFKRDASLKEMAKEYTPESIQKWINSGNMADLKSLKLLEAAQKQQVAIDLQKQKAIDAVNLEKQKATDAEARAEKDRKSREKVAGISATARKYAADKGVTKKESQANFADYYASLRDKDPEVTYQDAYDSWKGAGRGNAELENIFHPKDKGKTSQPPTGFKDSGKTSGGKKVYIKGNQAWIAP